MVCREKFTCWYVAKSGAVIGNIQRCWAYNWKWFFLGGMRTLRLVQAHNLIKTLAQPGRSRCVVSYFVKVSMARRYIAGYGLKTCRFGQRSSAAVGGRPINCWGENFFSLLSRESNSRVNLQSLNHCIKTALLIGVNKIFIQRNDRKILLNASGSKLTADFIPPAHCRVDGFSRSFHSLNNYPSSWVSVVSTGGR